MGKESRANPLVAQLKEALVSRNAWGVYDQYGREVKAGDLIRMPNPFTGDWLVQEVRPAMEREYAEVGKRLVHVHVVVQQHFVVEAGARAPGLLQAVAGAIQETSEKPAEAQEEEPGAPSPLILP